MVCRLSVGAAQPARPFMCCNNDVLYERCSMSIFGHSVVPCMYQHMYQYMIVDDDILPKTCLSLWAGCRRLAAQAARFMECAMYIYIYIYDPFSIYG